MLYAIIPIVLFILSFLAGMMGLGWLLSLRPLWAYSVSILRM